ncbi:hypothetical protein KUH32_04890 [Thalassococcus sp. CAU 1522]|uniref:DUF1772 domain-containing protein n=1 Tax=Thalassococcus arenae TaxID=2851652 RepID=A0ABS6N513_9RHOB|nr:hypothetical protein [Thalassococcus arenae]MBV2359104.1 hypothetical protein [Thalassococcus arenae]
MSKPVVFILLLGLAAIAAGLFGALHNQLSYSVGASYFFDLKFDQFGIAEDARNRLGAALVGWRASWWMGMLLGLPVFLLGLLLIRKPGHLLAAGIGAMGVVLFAALLCAMGGLLLGMLAPSLAAGIALPQGLSDPEGFLRAALMHEGAYLGGLIGLVAALWTIWRAARTERHWREARRS